uniref:AlNc14C9G1131 protein n=1 Tax=Albugo laibachii Nc14 TaxID=890382 RepID=F0W258_9STRA|nr:AlNc14C9G1131 [Albugo laibachii Nc14]|eukprot:CCA15140.1 AlNc14C9G1131 [Albugo laibachii Nc14]
MRGGTPFDSPLKYHIRVFQCFSKVSIHGLQAVFFFGEQQRPIGLCPHKLQARHGCKSGQENLWGSRACQSTKAEEQFGEYDGNTFE